jgi:AcrR family transcriptional regulator
MTGRQDGMSARDSYHHGNLRLALVEAGLELLETDGPEGLSLRRVASQVGVSHAAPAHHFPTLRHLLTALATQGFELFAAAMAAARAAAPADPAAQLRAAARAYLGFAKEHPGLFRLMFTRARIDWDDGTLVRAADAAYAQLSAVVAPAAGRLGLTADADIEALERLVWTQVHGEAHLVSDGKLDPAAPVGTVDLAGLLFAPRPPG